MQDLKVCFEDESCISHDYLFPNDLRTKDEEDQYVTQVVHGKLKTERIKRGFDPLVPLTEREIEKCDILK